MISLPKDQYGDFQTPLELANAVLGLLKRLQFARVLEPTCGSGNFIRAAQKALPSAEVIGVELQPEYAEAAGRLTKVHQADAMQFDFAADLAWHEDGRLLVVGNPPWVTNSDLTRMASANKPKLENIRGLSGLEAMTGASNFDLAESIILKLLVQLAPQQPTIAMLCKSQVARNILQFAEQNALPLKSTRVYGLDAKKRFGANVDACLLILETASSAGNYVADVFDSLDAAEPTKRIGVIDGRLVSNVDDYERTRFADGDSHLEWRQGVKHDASAVMELEATPDPRRKDGELLDLEPTFLYPLLKCTDVFRGRTTTLAKWMVVPQRHPSDDTDIVAVEAPKTYAYLEEHAEKLDGRKSSIYTRRPRFAVFGIGDYSFAPYKVAISGMHKDPVFRLVGPIAGKPVVFDDVTYIAPFDRLDDAAITLAVLTSEPADALIRSLSFTDSKRPITKKLLQRINVAALSTRCDADALVARSLRFCVETGSQVAEDDLRTALLRLQQGISAFHSERRDSRKRKPAAAN